MLENAFSENRPAVCVPSIQLQPTPKNGSLNAPKNGNFGRFDAAAAAAAADDDALCFWLPRSGTAFPPPDALSRAGKRNCAVLSTIGCISLNSGMGTIFSPSKVAGGMSTSPKIFVNPHANVRDEHFQVLASYIGGPPKQAIVSVIVVALCRTCAQN